MLISYIHKILDDQKLILHLKIQISLEINFYKTKLSKMLKQVQFFNRNSCQIVNLRSFSLVNPVTINTL